MENAGDVAGDLTSTEAPKEDGQPDVESSFPLPGAANDEKVEKNENQEVQDHPLSPKAEETPAKLNPFLCDNAEDTPFTSSEMSKQVRLSFILILIEKK